jgi:hypothetical protein
MAKGETDRASVSGEVADLPFRKPANLVAHSYSNARTVRPLIYYIHIFQEIGTLGVPLRYNTEFSI